jgi:competence ComEA-like helix-hairpin-helix protein
LIFYRIERVGIQSLAVILMIVIILPLLFHNNEIPTEDMEKLKKEMDIFLAEMERQSVRKQKLDTVFMFDPNVIDSASLVLLGFSPLQAKSIIKYRSKGGRFYNRESFGKSFVVSEQMFTRLYHYINIKPEPSRNKRIETQPDKPKKNTAVEQRPERKDPSEQKESSHKPVRIYTVELNAADLDELQKFRGIGEYYAKKIAEYRDKLGGFYKAEQLMEIRGIDSARFEMFRNQILIDTSRIRRIKINSVTENDLSKHPYINRFVAKSIIKYRKFKGSITSADEMVREKILSPQLLEQIASYIEY